VTPAAVAHNDIAAAVLQVEIEIETADKGGTFLGSIVLPGAKPLSLGHALARLGLAKTQQFFDASRVKGGQELLAAIQAAKEARLKVRVQPMFGSPAHVCRATAHGHTAGCSLLACWL
jgi:hypothetical protein